MTLAHAIPRHAEGSAARRAWQGKYQRANKNRKPCIAVALLRVLASPTPPRWLLLCYCFCHTSRFAKSCAWHFGLVFHSALTFTLPSLILSCLPTLPLASCPMRHAPRHLPLACHAAIGRAAQRNEPINSHKLLLAKYALLNLLHVPGQATAVDLNAQIIRQCVTTEQTVCTYRQSRQCAPTYRYIK